VSRILALDSRIVQMARETITLGPIADLRRQEDADDWECIRLNSTLTNLGDLIDSLSSGDRQSYKDRLTKLGASVKQLMTSTWHSKME
jgi:hypothetical protein